MSRKKGEMVRAFPCATIASTQAEKLVSMMRRTAASMRNMEQVVDESLVRHIYDNFCIVREKGVNIPALTHFIQQCIEQDNVLSKILNVTVISILSSANHLLRNSKEGWKSWQRTLFIKCAINNSWHQGCLVKPGFHGKKPMVVFVKPY
nr:nucleotidyl transferase AbiEii/AbiGii toxin family protein [Dickeya dianthicola]